LAKPVSFAGSFMSVFIADWTMLVRQCHADKTTGVGQFEPTLIGWTLTETAGFNRKS
jgi:hypothetical protein